jgi:hypothetical protein
MRIMESISHYQSSKGFIKEGDMLLVRTGDYKREWKLAKVICIYISDKKDDENNQWQQVDLSVLFVDGCRQYLSDIEGLSRDEYYIA